MRDRKLYLCGGDYLHRADNGCPHCREMSQDEARKFLNEERERGEREAVERYRRKMRALNL